MSNATFHRQVSNMAELMTAADFSFGAGGTSHWERCCVGLPTAVTVVAPNQSAITRDLFAKEVVLMSGSGARISASRYRSTLDTLTSEQLLAMQSASLALVDGRGTERVVLGMCLEPVVLRRASAEDAVKAWSWRNHPSTRKYSSNPKTVALAEHIVWWKNSLENSGRALLIGSRCGVEVGVLRYDMAGEGSAVVSVYLDPALHGLGLGVYLLRAGQEWLSTHRSDIREIEAVILLENISSQHAFAKAGFRFEQNRWIWNGHRSGA
jgi:RimJ/RimL family protein N-acetyltransferase